MYHIEKGYHRTLPDAGKILSTIKGLREHLQPNEEPLVTFPGIWDSGQASRRAMTCEIILTNQRLIGYAHVKFPRERLFLETIPLETITNVALRQKSFEPLFRELLVSDRQHRVYIRSSRAKIELLYSTLRSAIGAPADAAPKTGIPSSITRTAPVYGRQEIRTTFEQSLLGLSVLFVGGLLLEVIGVIAWSATRSSQVGLPLCVAGFVAVITAIFIRRARTSSR